MAGGSGILTDAEARLGVMVMSPLAVQGGGVPFLTTIVAAATPASLFADRGSEDNLDLPDLLRQVGSCERKGQ